MTKSEVKTLQIRVYDCIKVVDIFERIKDTIKKFLLKQLNIFEKVFQEVMFGWVVALARAPSLVKGLYINTNFISYLF